jgi:hypothetical protein
MQVYSLLNWDRAVDLGLQNERFTGDAAERAWAEESWGVAVVDMLWALPIGIVALFGLFRKRLYGFSAGLMELAIVSGRLCVPEVDNLSWDSPHSDVSVDDTLTVGNHWPVGEPPVL